MICTRGFGARVTEEIAARLRLNGNEAPGLLRLQLLFQLFVIDAVTARDHVLPDRGQFVLLNARWTPPALFNASVFRVEPFRNMLAHATPMDGEFCTFQEVSDLLTPRLHAGALLTIGHHRGDAVELIEVSD